MINDVHTDSESKTDDGVDCESVITSKDKILACDSYKICSASLAIKWVLRFTMLLRIVKVKMV
jgi:hypothetical protein